MLRLRHLSICHLILAAVLPIVVIVASPAFGQYEPPGCLTETDLELADLLNDYRETNGLARIPVSTHLSELAQWHIADSRYATEVSGEWGSDPSCNLHSWYGIPNAPYLDCCYYSDHSNPYCMWDKPAETSGGVYGPFGFELAASGYTDVAAALAGFQSSPGHNDVILNLGIWAPYTWNAVGVGTDETNGFYFVWFASLADGAASLEACGPGTGPPPVPGAGLLSISLMAGMLAVAGGFILARGKREQGRVTRVDSAPLFAVLRDTPESSTPAAPWQGRPRPWRQNPRSAAYRSRW